MGWGGGESELEKGRERSMEGDRVQNKHDQSLWASSSFPVVTQSIRYLDSTQICATMTQFCEKCTCMCICVFV